MPKFNVHLRCQVRAKVPDVEAATQQEAIQAAIDRCWEHLHAVFGKAKPAPEIEYTEFDEEIPSALVDVVGDVEFGQSRDFDGVWDEAVQQTRWKEHANVSA